MATEEEKAAEREKELLGAKSDNPATEADTTADEANDDDFLDIEGGEAAPASIDDAQAAAETKENTPPDTDPEIVEDEKADDDKKPAEQAYVVVKSRKEGVLFAQPNPSDGQRSTSTGRSMVLQEGYNEVRLDVWEECRAELLAKGVKEFGRYTKPNGVVVAKAFNKFGTSEQRIIAANCQNVIALERWQTLPGIDAAVMTIITERLSKIRTYKPAKS